MPPFQTSSKLGTEIADDDNLLKLVTFFRIVLEVRQKLSARRVEHGTRTATPSSSHTFAFRGSTCHA
jgi:hypothetical protein